MDVALHLFGYLVEDYKETYPDDPYGAEAGENARVWRVYLEESGQLDEDMLRQFRDTLDVHLVFVRPLLVIRSTYILI